MTQKKEKKELNSIGNTEQDYESAAPPMPLTVGNAILQLDYDTMLLLRKYLHYTYAGSYYPHDQLRSHLSVLYEYCRPMMQASMNKKEFEQLEKDIDSEEFEILRQTYRTINEILYKKYIKRADVREIRNTKGLRFANDN